MATTSSKSKRRLTVVLSITALALVVIGGLFASGSDARKHRARTGTTAQSSTTVASAITRVATTRVGTSGVTQLTLHPKGAAATPTPTTTRSDPATRDPATTLASNRSDPRLRAIGFRSQSSLDDHYAKHGNEFGSISKAQYLSMAQDLRDAPLSRTVIEATQADGSISRFDRSTGGFLAFNPDLAIRTFFRPNGGEAYFRRAAGKSH